MEKCSKLSNVTYVKGVSSSQGTLKNFLVPGRHSYGSWKGIILISNFITSSPWWPSLCLLILWPPVSRMLLKDSLPWLKPGCVWKLQWAGSKWGCRKGSAFAPTQLGTGQKQWVRKGKAGGWRKDAVCICTRQGSCFLKEHLSTGAAAPVEEAPSSFSE